MRYGHKNIIYDGVNLSDYFDITDVVIAPFPARTPNTRKIPGGAGLHFYSVDEGERTITMVMSLIAELRNRWSAFQAWEKCLDILLKDEPKELYLDDERYLLAMALNGSEIERLGFRGVSDISWTAFDPYFYGHLNTFPLNNGANRFFVQGSAETYPLIEVTGVNGPLTVTDDVSGDKVVIPNIGNPTAKVIIDPKNLRCTVNGSYLPVDLDRTDYFALKPGMASVTLSAGNGMLSYRERFR